MENATDNTVVFLTPVQNNSRPRPHTAPKPIRRAKVNLSEGLDIWHRVTMQSVQGDSPDLTSRQMAVLMTVYLSEGPHTVRSLAKHLNVTKAVISRAIDRLSQYGYVERAPDIRDKRSVIMRRTSGGINYLRDFARLIQTEFA
ncbi:MarR family protein [Litorimonas taeanensis]|uniref:MarR family protein n=1 Tax=Litorimonas taeanensis TaxID=568099 RepID=A0A420WLY9_9PROT|nr:MarR family winged helix-turn-helix transcriptional regulator [Litorimonas taeanensis]RKQ72061.1 MarR family protein [Litorimonas taeanensis]